MNKNIIIGVMFALGATFQYSSLTAIIKAGAATMPLPMVVFMQSFIGLLIMIILVCRKGTSHFKRVMKTQKLSLHLLRGIVSLGVSYFMFAAVKIIPLVNAVLLANTAPLIVPLVAFMFFSHPINHRLWIPMLIGFIGVAMMLHPDGSIFSPVSLIALGAAVCMALTMLIVRKLSATETSETITFYFFLISTIISGAVAIHFWVGLTLSVWSTLCLIGVMFLGSNYFMTIALRYANAQLMSCMLYTNIIFATLISAVVWHLLPSVWTMGGILLTVIGGILCIRAEHIFQRKKTAFIEIS